MKKLLDSYCCCLEWSMGIALAVLVLLVFGNVVLRYAFNSGVAATEELGRWLFVWLVFVGAVVGLRDRAHLGSDFVVSRLGRRGKRICLAVGIVVMLHSSWLLALGSYEQMLVTKDTGSPVLGNSMAIFYGAGLLFGVSAIVILAVDFWRAISGDLTEGDMSMSRGSEEDVEVEQEIMQLPRRHVPAPVASGKER